MFYIPFAEIRLLTFENCRMLPPTSFYYHFMLMKGMSKATRPFAIK